MMKYAVVLGCALVLAGCNSNDCVATSVGSCQSSSTEEPGTGNNPTNPTDTSGLAQNGALPSGAHISLDCRPYNVPGFSIHDCLYSHWHGTYDHQERHEPVDCTMKLGDRNGRIIGTRTQVAFASEAGAVSAVATTPAFDASKPTSQQKDLGHAVGFLEVFGAPLPRDVTPFPGEQSRSVDFGCGLRTSNPRDGLVTVIAYVMGEEGFVDSTGNGQYDVGERFVDMGEPYVDANDNGVFDAGFEWYFDANKDGLYTGPNGQWDSNTMIWSQTRVIYSGLPWQEGTLFSFYRNRATGLTESFDVSAGPPPTTQTYDVFLTDANLNPMSSLATFEIASTAGNVDVAMAGPFNTADVPGVEDFRMLYCDAPENPTQCFDGPVEHACRSTPCFVNFEVARCRTGNCSGFSYFNHALVSITGKRPGADTVLLSTTLDEIIVSLPAIPGIVRP